MAETTEKKPAEAKTGEKKPKKGPAPTIGAEPKAKNVWTLKKCLKVAGRFSTEAEWAASAPAAYKSATAHGWLAQCTSKMSGGKSVRKSA